MDASICEHCGTISRVKSWNLGKTRLSICWACAIDLITMQKEMKEWVD